LPRVLPERIEIGTPIKMIASLACFIVAANVTTKYDFTKVHSLCRMLCRFSFAKLNGLG
jgi:hypothetical protein